MLKRLDSFAYGMMFAAVIMLTVGALWYWGSLALYEVRTVSYLDGFAAGQHSATEDARIVAGK